MNIFGTPTVDSVINALAQTVNQLDVIRTTRETEIKELTEKMNVALDERNRSERIAEKLRQLLV